MKKLLIALCISMSHYYATASQLTDNSMTQIKKWEDLKPFADKIVALTASDPYFTNFNSTSLIYAYVSAQETSCLWDIRPTAIERDWILMSGERPETGFEINRLIWRGAYGTMCVALNSRLTKANLLMRFTTAEEKATLRTEIKNGQLSFGGLPDRRNAAHAALNNYVKKLYILSYNAVKRLLK